MIDYIWKEMTSIKIVPNPTNNKIHIQMNANQTENLSIQLSDLTGNLLIDKSISLSVGENKYIFDISTLASGVYLLNILENNQMVFSDKVVKQ